MKVAQINATAKTGSTGKIVNSLKQQIVDEGNECIILAAYGQESNEDILITSKLPNAIAVKSNLFISRLTGRMGYNKEKVTKKAIEWLKEQNVDIIHLHNIHGNWINIEMLFEYIKKENLPVVWTLHDCWAFTGRCSHFEKNMCNQWKEGCKKCPTMDVYPISYFFDSCKEMYEDKKRWFLGVENLIFTTPSSWLSEYLQESFLKEYPVEVVHNGIDTSKYVSTTECTMCFDVNGKKIVLGVANAWDERKGLNDFIKMFSMLDRDKYQIILVGLNKVQLKKLPSGIIGISHTESEQQLVELYSMADVFVNPTYEDNYPTTNLEAISCGTPVITYRTGGSPESILDGCGYIVEQGDIADMCQKIIIATENGKINKNILAKIRLSFDTKRSLQEYIKLYERLLTR